MKNVFLMSLCLSVSLLSGCGSDNTTTRNGANVVPAQNCPNGLTWNSTINQCVNVNGTNVNGTQQLLPGQTQVVQAQDCPTANGLYFNGSSCSAIVIPGGCQNGGISGVNTQAYGCARLNTQCDSQYSYMHHRRSRCMPVNVIVYDDYYQYDQNNSYNDQYNQSPGGCMSAACGCYGGSYKIKYRRDGSIRKIKCRN